VYSLQLPGKFWFELSIAPMEQNDDSDSASVWPEILLSLKKAMRLCD
jgi:hypothetical protein